MGTIANVLNFHMNHKQRHAIHSNHIKSLHQVVCYNANALVGISNQYLCCNYYTFLQQLCPNFTIAKVVLDNIRKCVSSSITQDIQCIWKHMLFNIVAHNALPLTCAHVKESFIYIPRR